jgi:hypothetical protein
MTGTEKIKWRAWGKRCDEHTEKLAAGGKMPEGFARQLPPEKKF